MYALYTSGTIAATSFHKKMIKCVTFSPTVFFDKNPSGRILNRFSNDISACDS